METGSQGYSSPMASFSALCFGPGLQPHGEKIPVRIGEEGLCLWPAEPREQIIPYQDIQVSAGGFDHEQMILAWSKDAQAWSLTLTDKHTRDILLAHAPPALAPQLVQWCKKIHGAKKRMRAGWLALVLFLLAPFLLLAVLLWNPDPVIGWAVNRISIENEQKLGDLIFEQTRPSLKLVTQGEAQRVIAEIGQKLAAGSPYTFKWHVADDPAINAFAIPGGHVVVFSGLIKAADTPEEVAGVLAHETEHVLQRHTLKAMVHNLGWRAVIAMVTGDWTGSLLGEFATQMGILKYGRDKESEADLKGLQLLKQAQIDPNGMERFFDKLSKQGGVQIALLSTHPASKERMEALGAAIKEAGTWRSQPLPYDWGRVKASLPVQ